MKRFRMAIPHNPDVRPPNQGFSREAGFLSNNLDVFNNHPIIW